MGARCPRGHLGLLSAHDQVVASLLRALPLPAAPRFSRGNGLTTSPLAPAPLGRCAPRCRTACTLPDSEDAVLGTYAHRRLAPHCPPRTDGERAPPCCRPCLPPFPLAVLRYLPRHLAAFPPAAGAPRAPPMGVEPPPPRWVRWRASSSPLGMRERARALACSPLGCGPKLATVQCIPGPAVRWLCYLMVWRWSVLLQSLRPLGLAG